MVCETKNQTGYSLNGRHPNSLAALAKNRQSWQRCSREQCNRPAYKVSVKGFCYRCWKKWESRKKLGNDPHNTDVARLRFYKKMGPKLQAFVEECLAQPESDQFNLTQELAVSRDLLDEALGLVEAAKNLPDNFAGKTQRLVSAGSLLAAASKEVRETCKVGAEVFEKSREKYSIHTVVEIVAQIKRMIRICFEHDPEGLNKFDTMLDNQLRLPKIGMDGTYITADQDVMDMDATIPRVIDSSAEEPDSIDSVEELLLLECEQCNQQFNHPDENCICPNCETPLRVIEQV